MWPGREDSHIISDATGRKTPARNREERMDPDIGLANWFAQRALRTPERRALTFEGETWTYDRMRHEIEALAGRLRLLGVERKARVAFLGVNQPAFIFALFACARIGATFVPLNFRLTGAELEFIVNDAGARTLIADAQHRAIIDGVRRNLATVMNFVTPGGAEGWLPLEGDAEAAEAVRIEPGECALIMYTSGTTGRPKGAMLTHGNLWWNNVNTLLNLDILADDVTLTAAPLFHIGGLNVLTLITFLKGGEVVLYRGFDPGVVLAAIEEHRVSTMFGVPAMFQFMAAHPNFASADLSSLRLLVCGGAPCPVPLLEIYDARDIPVQQGYGLTETAPLVSFLAPEYAKSRAGSSGRSTLFTEVRLVAGDGSLVKDAGDRGEVHVHGPNVMAGYWNQRQATADAIDSEGWFKTGDVAYVDADGLLYICDRVKDMIISGGENVYPAEVESVLFKHPAVAEVAVIGTPDEKWGETAVAVCALKPGKSLTLEELCEFARPVLARYKLPQRLELVDALPRGASGKVLKYELRQRFNLS
jgi:fatty-acyl-CoA synthase